MSAKKTIFRRLLPGVLVLMALSAFAGPDTREPAPHFIAKTMGGEKFNNASIKGKVTLLEFWTTWCPYCRREESMVDDIHNEFADKGLIVLAVDVAESKKVVKKYLETHPRAVRIVLTEDTNLAAMYAAKSFPIYVAIDRDGNVAGIQHGAAGEGALRQLLRRAGLENAESDDE
jgi:thiol-disulfide isomerase/thioredoxin